MNEQLPTPISTEGPPIDVPLLRKAVEWAEAEAAKPEEIREWYQGAYASVAACGTAYCVAGWVVAITDGPFDPIDPEDDTHGEPIDDRASELLGLTSSESCRLFVGYNDITAVRTAAERIAARAGERL